MKTGRLRVAGDFAEFIVTNKSGITYKMKLDPHGNGSCTCPDFQVRIAHEGRICKHIARPRSGARSSGRRRPECSHLGAAWLARRIGLVNTMVFTHLPSSLFLMAVPFAPSFKLAILLFLCREALVEMDVPTRQSYVAAIVGPNERTYASGVTNLARNVFWAVGSAAAGLVMQVFTFSAPLLIGGGAKVTYDILLYRSFRGLRPPEEMKCVQAR